MRVIGTAGWSGAGKTTLLIKVIPRMIARGVTVSTVKHAHHEFDVDKPGKDSYEHRLAGASEVLISSVNRYALMHELRGAPEPGVHELLQKLSPVDLVIIEGWKVAHYAKIEVFRREVEKAPLHPDDPWIKGIASDTPFPDSGLPVVALDDINAVADLMLQKAEPLDAVIARGAAAPPLAVK
ncbi:MAG TPA: molybdopterin-guanine dinucleotide biosynthesis protein B [Xanthobacteraceae bacterium]|nr:molybdopterin-guanine dinucleotide biosynthesis protein B [Xanthobacteraceae bacterium]